MRGTTTLPREKAIELERKREAEKVKVYGKHIYGNLYNCNKRKLSNPEFLKKVIEEAARVGNMTLLDIRAWKIGEGVSAVGIVLESHITIHTWPEFDFATADVYSCGAHTDPERAFAYVVRALEAKKVVRGGVDRSMYV